MTARGTGQLGGTALGEPRACARACEHQASDGSPRSTQGYFLQKLIRETTHGLYTHTRCRAARRAGRVCCAASSPREGPRAAPYPHPCLRSAGTPSHGCAASIQAGRAPQFQHTADPYSALPIPSWQGVKSAPVPARMQDAPVLHAHSRAARSRPGPLAERAPAGSRARCRACKPRTELWEAPLPRPTRSSVSSVAARSAAVTGARARAHDAQRRPPAPPPRRTILSRRSRPSPTRGHAPAARHRGALHGRAARQAAAARTPACAAAQRRQRSADSAARRARVTVCGHAHHTRSWRTAALHDREVRRAPRAPGAAACRARASVASAAGRLVDLDGRVDLAHEDVARVESDRAGQAEERVGHDRHVREVQDGWHHLREARRGGVARARGASRARADSHSARMPATPTGYARLERWRKLRSVRHVWAAPRPTWIRHGLVCYRAGTPFVDAAEAWRAARAPRLPGAAGKTRLGDVQLGVEVERGVEEQVQRGAARREERAPPARGAPGRVRVGVG